MAPSMAKKRSLFTKITPLPPHVTRDAAVEWLHNHKEMIELNPLVIRHGKCDPHKEAPDEEHSCHWYEMTDRINYLPGGLVKGEVTYKAAFHNLPHGLQTHVYAPAGLDLREKWTVCGNAPGETRAPQEIGGDLPSDGLYIREDVDMRCNVLLASFVKKNLNKSHKVVVDRVVQKAAASNLVGGDNDSSKAEQPGSTRAQTETLPVQAQDLSVASNDELTQPHGELAACQCADQHEPICSMYVDPITGRFADAQIDEQPQSVPMRDHRAVRYEPFEYVKIAAPDADNPELFSGNFHPLSHYHLLLGNSKADEDDVPFVQTAQVSVVRAELPASPN